MQAVAARLKPCHFKARLMRQALVLWPRDLAMIFGRARAGTPALEPVRRPALQPGSRLVGMG